ncbi:MAG: septum formation inhibitor Maf [Nonlabens sp.]
MKYFYLLLSLLLFCSCNQSLEKQTEITTFEKEAVTESTPIKKRNLDPEFKEYWYQGKAEISSYELSQVRYGESRDGEAVMIFVTEPFDHDEQVKSDIPSESDIPILKLNATRNFTTGIYPYNIMSSTFLPLDTDQHAVKVAGSIQEWCGQTYMQLNRNNDSYNVMLHSYFQSEGNKNFTIDNQMLENQIPLQLRLGPENMPVGEMNVIPSLEYLRLKHKETKPYSATAKLTEIADGFLYSIKYPELGRTIAFKTEKQFPYKILSWMDRYNDGGRPQVSTGTLTKTIKSDYWNKNSNADSVLRDSLNL